MAKITHSKMGRVPSPAQSAGGKEVYVVDDMSEQSEIDTVDQRLAEFEAPSTLENAPEDVAVEFKMPPRQNSETQKKTLESLIFMGRHSKEVEIADHKFEISTLTHKEHNNIVKELMTFGDAADLFTIRVLTLAYAVKSIDDVSLDDLDIGGDFENDYHKRTTIIDNLQLALVERLNAEYEKMVEEAESVVYHEAIKN
jgi:hypothetical protein